MCKTTSSCVSITLQIVQIEIVNWKHVNFEKVFTLAWGGSSGNSKKEYIAKLQCKQLFFRISISPCVRKNHMIIL